MIIQSTHTIFELRGDTWLAKYTSFEMNYTEVLNPILHYKLLASLRQHQTFALLNPEE